MLLVRRLADRQRIGLELLLDLAAAGVQVVILDDHALPVVVLGYVPNLGRDGVLLLLDRHLILLLLVAHVHA